MQLTNNQQNKIATGTALAFHVSGIIAIGFFHSQFFIGLTWLNLLVCMSLVFWTQQKINIPFLAFAFSAFIIGFASEYIGVNTGVLFGNYSYGNILGPKWNNVPWMIGVQWLVTIYCIGIAMHMLHDRLRRNREAGSGSFPGWWTSLSIIMDGAMLAVVFDWVLEPVAVQLGYWQWVNNEIPSLNYFSWYGVSVLILAIFHKLPFPKQNLFAVHLLLIQFMFFLLLRTFIKFGI